MNAVFCILILCSIATLIFVNPQNAFPALIDGASGAITLSIKLVAIYAVWLSVLKMMEATRLDTKLSKLMRPIVRKLFKGESDDAYDKICINLSANMLGMGGVATPAGIQAMSAMHKGEDKASDNMIMLLVINATSIQLIPATMIALLSQSGADNPSSIILPTLISSGVATLLGVVLCKVLALKKDADNDKIECLYNQNHTLKRGFCKNRQKIHIRNKRP